MNKLKKYFIPHKGNEYKPLFFRARAVLATASLIVFLFFFSASLGTIVVKNTSQLGAVISSVLVNLTNDNRTANKLQGLAISPVLTEVAQMKADDMAEKGYFAHTSPDGKTPWYWFKQAGYNYSFAGENLAVYFSDSAELEQAWMNSPTHRANILNSSYTEIGIALAHGKYQGVDTVFVVQEFGQPNPSVNSGQAVIVAKSAGVKIVPKEIPVAKVATAEQPTVKGVTSETSPIILKVVASPKTFLETAYEWLAIFIVFALVIMIVIEIKRQHFRHILYGISLLLLMIGFIFLLRFFFFGKLLVI